MIDTNACLYLVVAVVVIAPLAIGRIWPMETPPSNAHLLLKNKTKVPRSQRQERLDFLSNAIQQQLSTHTQVLQANEANRMQARLFYVAILAVLASGAFALPDPYVCHVLTVTAVAFGVVLYLLDVHMRDMSDRQATVRRELHNTVATLTRIPANDYHWYQIDHAKVDTHFAQMHAVRWSRKFRLMLSPDIEQSLFYFAPVLIFLVARFILLMHSY